jgi:hypothetical protein
MQAIPRVTAWLSPLLGTDDSMLSSTIEHIHANRREPRISATYDLHVAAPCRRSGANPHAEAAPRAAHSFQCS